MQQYYYAIVNYPDCPISSKDFTLLITGKAFFDKFGCMSDATSAHYDDETDSQFGGPACVESENEDDNDYGLKYIDNELLSFLEELEEKYEVGEACTSQYMIFSQYKDTVEKLFEAHPNFHRSEAYDDYAKGPETVDS